MNIIHVMADGSKRKSIEGIVIQSEDFYRVAKAILERKRATTGGIASEAR